MADKMEYTTKCKEFPKEFQTRIEAKNIKGIYLKKIFQQRTNSVKYRLIQHNTILQSNYANKGHSAQA